MIYQKTEVQKEYERLFNREKPVFYCEDCETPFYHYDKFVDFHGDHYCEECAKKMIMSFKREITTEDFGF